MDQETLNRIEALEVSLREHRHNTIDSTSTLTDTVYVSYTLPGTDPQFADAQTHFFTATRPCRIQAISIVYTHAAGFSATGIVERLTGTTPPGSGTSLVLSGFNLNSATNTVQRVALIDRPSLAIGDRLSFLVTGSPTNSKNLNITIELQV